MSAQPDQSIIDFLARMEANETRRDQALKNGLPALHRLVTIATGDTGQCIAVRRLLLGLYNGHAFPFDLTQLRGLDSNIYDDCIAVINLDARATMKEIHMYIDNGKTLFRTWAEEFKRHESGAA